VDIIVTDFSTHAIVNPLLGSEIDLIRPRSIGKFNNPTPAADAPRVDELANTGPNAVALSVNDPNPQPRKFPLMVAVEKSAPKGVITERGSTRIVVVGDSIFLANVPIQSVANRDFAGYAVNWLLERTQLLEALGPRPIIEYKLVMTRKQLQQAEWLLLAALPLLRGLGSSQGVALFDAFYRSGALVFGGGHVVLPLLRSAFVAPGWVSDDAFLAGYGAAQAIPGPLFTFAAYLGAVAEPSPHGVAGAALGLIGIFLPGMLILVGALPFWETLRARAGAQAAMRGVNAAVVGILGGAFYDPVWTSTVKSTGDFGVALIGFVLLIAWRAPPLLVVVIGALAGVALAQTHFS